MALDKGPVNRESRIWRRLAIAGAAATGLLTVRAFITPLQPSLFRLLHPEFWAPGRARLLRRVGEPGEPVGEEELFTETWEQELERRLSACESNAAEIGELRNMINEIRPGYQTWGHPGSS